MTALFGGLLSVSLLGAVRRVQQDASAAVSDIVAFLAGRTELARTYPDPT